MQAMMALEIAVERSGLEASLLYLVKLLASRINGCGFCVDLHSSDALAAGEQPRRLHAVAGWRNEDCFTPREIAAFTWTEALARLSGNGVADADYAVMAGEFSPSEQGALTLAISAALAWNRFGIGFRATPTH
jgi:AhpD family alkylhydroperoxidase